MMTKTKKAFLIDLIILVITAIALAVSMAWSKSIELKLGLCYYVDENGERVEVAQSKNGAIRSADENDAPRLDVHFVDVGQGDCCIIEFPDGKTAIIDGGERGNTHVTEIKTFIQNNLPADFMYFDYCILTHPDSDHCGSLDDTLNAYPARVCYRPNVRAYYAGTATKPEYIDPATDLTSDAVQKDGETYALAIKAMYAPTAEHDFTPTVYVTDPADETQTITGGSDDNTYSLTFYSPLGTLYTGEGDWNNYSPIMVLEYRGYRFVMSGDAEEKNLGEFVAKVAAAPDDGVTDKYDVFTDEYCANVIKAGHHGSRNATTTEFLEAVTSPDKVASSYSVISCGEGNKYKHPHAEALNRITGVGIKQENILRTDEKGDISFSVRIDEDGNYNLFYGEVKAPDIPDAPDVGGGDDEGDDEKVLTLVYEEIGGIRLTWAVVGWTAYACFAVVLVILTLAYVYGFIGRKGRGGSNSSHSVTAGGKTKSSGSKNSKGGQKR